MQKIEKAYSAHLLLKEIKQMTLPLEADATLMIITTKYGCFKITVWSVLNKETSTFLFCLPEIGPVKVIRMVWGLNGR